MTRALVAAGSFAAEILRSYFAPIAWLWRLGRRPKPRRYTDHEAAMVRLKAKERI